MRILELSLKTNKLPALRKFYSEKFEFKILDESSEHFSIQVGHTRFSFERSSKTHVYHYCFLIPSNMLQKSIEWLQARVDLFTYEGGRVIEPASTEWNADSVYFMDAGGNIAEFIVRYDLKNPDFTEHFGPEHLLSVNEIGMPANNTSALNKVLEEEMGSPLWTGNLTRFGANGTQEGLFLLLNYNQKKTWFPTDIFPQPSAFRGIFESSGTKYHLSYKEEQLALNKLNS